MTKHAKLAKKLSSEWESSKYNVVASRYVISDISNEIEKRADKIAELFIQKEHKGDKNRDKLKAVINIPIFPDIKAGIFIAYLNAAARSVFYIYN